MIVAQNGKDMITKRAVEAKQDSVPKRGKDNDTRLDTGHVKPSWEKEGRLRVFRPKTLNPRQRQEILLDALLDLSHLGMGTLVFRRPRKILRVKKKKITSDSGGGKRVWLGTCSWDGLQNKGATIHPNRPQKQIIPHKDQ